MNGVRTNMKNLVAWWWGVFCVIGLTLTGCSSSCCPGECCTENAVCCGKNLKADAGFNRAYDDTVEIQNAQRVSQGY
jgi:hypothetical protein